MYDSKKPMLFSEKKEAFFFVTALFVFFAMLFKLQNEGRI
jgi:hypothetical protein